MVDAIPTVSMKPEVPGVDAASTAVEVTNADNVAIKENVPFEASDKAKQIVGTSGTVSTGVFIKENVHVEASDKGKQIVGTSGVFTRSSKLKATMGLPESSNQSGGVVTKENVPVEASNKGKVDFGFLGTGGIFRREFGPEKYDLDGYGARVGHLSNIQLWERLYPGWKINPTTGEWYQVHNGHDALQGDADSSYNGTLDRYPSHMVFDLNCPGWYYDTNVEEWKTMNSYISSLNLAMDDSEIQVAGSVNAASKSTMAPVTETDISRSPRRGQSDSSNKESSPESKGGTSCGFGLQLIRRTVGKVFRPKGRRQVKSNEETAIPPFRATDSIQPNKKVTDNKQDALDGDSTAMHDGLPHSPAPPVTMQRSRTMNNISFKATAAPVRRTASWSGISEENMSSPPQGRLHRGCKS